MQDKPRGRPSVAPSERRAICPHRLRGSLLDAVTARADALGVTPREAHEQALAMWLAAHP